LGGNGPICSAVLSLTLVLRAIPLIAIGGGNQVVLKALTDSFFYISCNKQKDFGPVLKLSHLNANSQHYPPAKSRRRHPAVATSIEFCRWWFPVGILNLVVK